MSAKIEEESKAVEGLRKAEEHVGQHEEAKEKLDNIKKQSPKPDFNAEQMKKIFSQIAARKGMIAEEAPKEETKE